jgi:predicted ATPase
MMDRTVPSTIGKRYVLHERLGAGGMGVVYRATDRLTGSIVALKRVTTPAEQLTFASHSGDGDLSLALAQEFRTLASLRHPHIIRVLDYGFDQQRCPFFTMDLLKGAQTLVEAGQGQDRARQVDLLVQALQALIYLHRRNVLHRDLKPANVLVVDGRVKVLDFGVSVVTSATMEYLSRTTVGTFGYIAPELFAGEPFSRSSDLYALGVMAYEVFAGHHPYDTRNVAVLLHDLLSRPADLASIGVGDDLGALLERLLAKSREERPDDANQVVRELCAATGRPLPSETVEVRESYLQAARFVGRERELDHLSRVLGDAFAGQGSAWLVGGESGVGKSRLADELRTLALVRGVTVLSGQAVREGRSPYHLWRDVLRRLALAVDLAPEPASALVPLVPDIGDLLGRDVPDAPPRDPQGTQVRLLRAVSEAFRRLEGPALVLLEDLQWIGSDSLALLDHLAEGVAHLPLLVVGNYRDDERPHLPDEVPGMQVLKLGRLGAAGVAELSASMVGDAGRRPQVVDLLRRETEGNPFFLVEVVRVLAERAGSLEAIGRTALPERVFAGGVQEVVRSRLSRVPPGAQPLLQLAAIGGRELDQGVLRALAESADRLAPEADLDAWLHACADVAVLEAQGARWRFAHDRLREGVLDALAEGERPALYQRVAEAIEGVYPDAPEQVATLAHLWGVAGDVHKERHYCKLAGEQSVRNSANVEAIRFLNRALELLAAVPDTPERAQEELAMQLALMTPIIATQSWGAPEAGRAAARARELCQQVGDTAQVFSAMYFLQAFYESREGHRVGHELGEHIFELAERTQDPQLTILGHMAVVYPLLFLGELVSARAHAEQVLALYDPRQHCYQAFVYGQDTRVTGLSFAIYALWLLGYPDQALQRSQEMLAWACELDHPFSENWALTFAARLHRWRYEVQAVQELAQAMDQLWVEEGFPLAQTSAEMDKAWARSQQKGIDEEAITAYRQALAACRAVGFELHRPEFLSVLAEMYATIGQTEKGLAALAEALAWVKKTDERYWEAELHRLKGELLLMRDATAEAEASFHQAIEVARGQGARSLELRAATSLSRLWQQQDKREEARQMLAEIYGWFTEGFETRDLQEARALLDRLA